MKTHETKSNVKRPPVVVVMGHIDHGKSTLLDYIRKSNTAEKEAGGITQHIGAYEAIVKDKAGAEHRVTFIDTPGHEAFETIRECGTRAADVAVLVVSSEDGVKPQTLEALKCIKNGNIPFVVAITKIDRPGFSIERTKANLAEHGVYVEGYGGDISFVPLSAITGEGVHELLDLIILVAELQELTADPRGPASGIIIEAHSDERRGVTATIIVKQGALAVGTYLVSRDSFTPVRAIENYAGKLVQSIGPGSPARITGWNKLPKAGNPFETASSKREAEAQTAACSEKPRCVELWKPEDEKREAGKFVIPLIIKADTAGSLDAVAHEVKKVSVEGVLFKTLLAGVGTITENDVKTAAAGKDSLVLGFNTKIDASAKAMAERMHMPIHTFNIIYRLTEWLQTECEKRRPRVEVKEETGCAKVLKLFSAEKDKCIIGGRVESGTIRNGASVKILRRDSEIASGRIRSLQQQKLKIEEAGKDTEFGAMVESKIEPAPGDRLVAFTITTK